VNEKNWRENVSLFDAYKKIIKESLEDERFGFGSFEKCFRLRIKKYVHEWTWNKYEREILIQDMTDSAIDEVRNGYI
jgi:hypothetical protein